MEKEIWSDLSEKYKLIVYAINSAPKSVGLYFEDLVEEAIFDEDSFGFQNMEELLEALDSLEKLGFIRCEVDLDVLFLTNVAEKILEKPK